MFKFVVISALLTVSASATPTPPTGSENVASKTSMQTVESSYNFNETIAQLKQFIEEKGLTTFTEIDHAKGAEEAGLTLEPATVLIFGNPKAGTLLMQDDINIAVDLPLKVLVFIEDEKVMVGYRVPTLTMNHYNLTDHRGILTKMDGLFKKMTDVVRASTTPTPLATAPAVAHVALKTSMQTIESSNNFEETVAQLKQFIEEKGLTTFAEINHAKGAEEAGLTLEPATVLIFGNPKAGTLLMQDDINIAVDLPLKVLVFIEDEKVMVGYRVPTLTMNHYNLSDHRGILTKMDGLFKKMTDVVKASATPTPLAAAPAVAEVALKTSMQTIKSSHSFEETVAQLKQFIEEKGLTTFAEIDHAKGAEEVGLTLEPATVLIFGNPKAGTLLMQDDINIAVDLPLKVLVFVENEKVMVGYRVPSLTLNHYNLSDHRGILTKMDGLFKKMTDVVRAQ